MKLPIKFLGLSMAMFTALSCEKELDLNFPVSPSKMVVEGWIEIGRNAQVILSHSAPYFIDIDSNSISNFSERWAKVTLTSETATEILTLRKNNNYFPPMVYVSSMVTGEPGQTYSIEIISEKYGTITATTTIPEPVELDSVWYQDDGSQNNRGRIWIRISDDGNKEDFYRILFMRKGKETTYTATNISTFSDVLFNGEKVDMGFLRGFSNATGVQTDNYFYPGDTISVKFCTIDKEQYEFWNVYQNKVLSAANPLATNSNQLKTNVKGGLGVFTGYGATYYLVIAK